MRKKHPIKDHPRRTQEDDELFMRSLEARLIECKTAQ